MDTKAYKTKTCFKEVNNVKTSDTVWNVGLDVGYSAVKVFSGNAIVCFPAYALEDNLSDREINIGTANSHNNVIKYRGENGVIWTVGASAQDRIDPTDTSAGSSEIFNRNRYETQLYKILVRVGLASGLRKNEYGDPAGKRLRVVTGLPPKYMRSDTSSILNVLSGSEHHFDVKFGDNDWEHFDISLAKQDVEVICQPEGTLYSIATNRTFNFTKDAFQYFQGNILIMDTGFGTLDMFPFIKGKVDASMCRTYPEFGMRQVIQDTVDEISDLYHTDISVPAFQQNLATGRVRGKIGNYYGDVDINPLLEKHSKDVCHKALERIIEGYDPAGSYDYFVITGGTGAAWNSYIREHEYFANNPVLQVVSGNQGDPELPYLFSNVRGYYIEASVRATNGD